MYKLSLINPPHVPSLSGLCYVNVETLGLLNKINTSNYICVLAQVAGIPKISIHKRSWKRARRTDELSAGMSKDSQIIVQSCSKKFFLGSNHACSASIQSLLAARRYKFAGFVEGLCSCYLDHLILAKCLLSFSPFCCSAPRPHPQGLRHRLRGHRRQLRRHQLVSAQ